MKATKLTKFQDDESEEPSHKHYQEGKSRKSSVSVSGSLMHLNAYERMLMEVDRILDTRSRLQIYEEVEDEKLCVTPKPLQISNEREGFEKLTTRCSSIHIADSGLVSFKSVTSGMLRSRGSKGMLHHASIEDLIEGIGIDRITLDTQTFSWPSAITETAASDLSDFAALPLRARKKFIRIILRKTELQLLYEQPSMTAIKSTEDGILVEKDNKDYDYLTIGRGKIRRRSEAEAQTVQTLFKAREVNTKVKTTRDVASYVSYFEMFDTYKMLQEIENDTYEEPKKLHFSQNKTPEEQFAIIAQLPRFNGASVIIKRLLAGNTFEKGQRRFRNMSKITRTVDKISYKYTLNELFIIDPANTHGERRAVADMSFCPTNSDILAVAYGIYSHQAAKLPLTGEVCIWSIKNPCDPERFYAYSTPVVSVEFSPYTPTLIAVGLFDGSVEVRDIAYINQIPVAVAKRTPSSGVDPILDIKWIKQSTNSEYEEIDPFVALSQDGSARLFRIINSPFLSGFKLMSLERLEGMPEGLVCTKPTTELLQHSNRSPQGLSLAKHPTQLDIYYILTDEGCIHMCSTNYQHHYIKALKTHDGSVNFMDFSPWSPKLFLTCGNDWCIRIWMDGIFEPLITLKSSYQPYNWASWSRTHSTILVAVNRKQVEIWDLKRNILQPMSINELDSAINTMGIYSLDGTSILIGKERGQVSVCAIDEMPFPSYYQYDALEKAIFKAVSNYPDLLLELKSVGYFGYPKQTVHNITK